MKPNVKLLDFVFNSMNFKLTLSHLNNLRYLNLSVVTSIIVSNLDLYSANIHKFFNNIFNGLTLLNLVMMVWIFTTATAASKYDAQFESGQKCL